MYRNKTTFPFHHFFHSVSEWVTRWIGLQRGYLVVFLVCGVLTLNFCIAHLCSFKY